MEKLQGAINKLTLDKPPQWYFRVAQLRKAITAIKERPNLNAEEAIKLKFKKPDGILKQLHSNHTPMKLARIHGIGPAKASILRNKGITNINQLRNRTNLLTNAQKLGLKMHNNASKRIPREDIEKFEKDIKKYKNGLDIVITGSYRRGEKTSGDIDILVTGSESNYRSFIKKLIDSALLYKEHLSYGSKKWLGYGIVGNPKRYARVDILVTPKDELPFALLYFTGSQEFNEGMRAFAKQLGYSLNERELKGVKRSFKEEKDIFQFLGLEYVEPTKRQRFIGPSKHSSKNKVSAMLAVETMPNDIIGWYMSEKLDGIRALWNGKVLYSRTQKVINAPEWFKESLPQHVHIDGELFIGRAKFEQTQSIVMKKNPVDEEWKKIKFMCFDIINDKPFVERYSIISRFKENAYFKIVPQEKITSKKQFDSKFAEITKAKGEGLMIREPNSKYEQKRSKSLVKVKPKRDAEAIVQNVEKGKGRLKNMMGKLLVKNKNSGVNFRIGTGFSNSQRKRDWKKGEVITYIYRDVTAKGVPRFASFKSLKN